MEKFSKICNGGPLLFGVKEYTMIFLKCDIIFSVKRFSPPKITRPAQNCFLSGLELEIIKSFHFFSTFL